MRNEKGQFVKGHPASNTGRTRFKKGHIAGIGNLIFCLEGKDNPNFKHGLYKNKDYINNRVRNYRRDLVKKIGSHIPSKEIVQMVYEDNIKKHGTLTCYLCLEKIRFGFDSIEHKIPLSRGGTHEYNNLAVACRSCNNKKHDLTEDEYRKAVC